MDDELRQSYEALDKFWAMKVREDNKMWINFITYFKTQESTMKAFESLSFSIVDNRGIKMPDGVIAKLHLMTDLNRIVLVYLMGKFTKKQAREVVSTFGRYIDPGVNDQYLPDVAAKFAMALQEKGGGGLIWTDWPDVTDAGKKKPFWKSRK